MESSHIELMVSTLLDLHKKAESFTKRTLPFPKVNFNLSGRCAGQAHKTNYEIRLNPFYANNGHANEIMTETLAHEYAHLLAYHLFGNEAWNHGIYWKSVMVKLGYKPTRCHDMPISHGKPSKKGA